MPDHIPMSESRHREPSTLPVVRSSVLQAARLHDRDWWCFHGASVIKRTSRRPSGMGISSRVYMCSGGVVSMRGSEALKICRMAAHADGCPGDPRAVPLISGRTPPAGHYCTEQSHVEATGLAVSPFIPVTAQAHDRQIR